DAEMHRALRELLGDLRRRQIRDLDPGEAGDGAAIVARTARLDELQARACEEVFRVLLQAALGRHGDDEGRAHDAPPSAARRSIHTAKPTAGRALLAPSRASMPS